MRQILHIALLQQLQMTLHNLRCHFHRPPPLFELRLGLCLEAAVGILMAVLFVVLRIHLAQFSLLRRNLDQQAFAQIRCRNTGWIEMLHQVDAALDLLDQRLSAPVPGFQEIAQTPRSAPRG